MNIESKFIRISISDNGCGLPVDDVNKLVEPYFTTRDKGTGLGLAVVKKIIDEHNGKLFIENIIDKENQLVGANASFTISKKLTLTKPTASRK